MAELVLIGGRLLLALGLMFLMATATETASRTRQVLKCQLLWALHVQRLQPEHINRGWSMKQRARRWARVTRRTMIPSLSRKALDHTERRPARPSRPTVKV